jgi:dTDP-4-dehydrorhamnose reductase
MLLVLGRNGQTAHELGRAAASRRMELAGRDAIDMRDPDRVADAIRRLAPEAVINAAAYTAVDRAESEEAEAFAINARSVGAAARACRDLGAPFVHISTDYVFAGTKDAPYVETDPVAPVSAYGRSKAAGEAEVLASGADAAIIRTAWVYSTTGTNFVRTMLRLAETRDEIGVVADQHGCPTHAADLAQACLFVADKLLAGDAAARGVFHYSGGGAATWADVAEEIFATSQRAGGPHARVRRIVTAEYPTPARRPANSRLDTRRMEALGVPVFPWRERVSDCVAALVGRQA